jgi:hypothetical protein
MGEYPVTGWDYGIALILERAARFNTRVVMSDPGRSRPAARAAPGQSLVACGLILLGPPKA